jgi:hypothetical protein
LGQTYLSDPSKHESDVTFWIWIWLVCHTQINMLDPRALGLAVVSDSRQGLAWPRHLDLATMPNPCTFFLKKTKYRNTLIIVLKTYLFCIFIFIYIYFFYFRTLTTCIPKIHSLFLLISNFSEEIIYKIVQIKIVKKKVGLLHIQYFLFLQYNVSIQKFKSFLLWSYISNFCIY